MKFLLFLAIAMLAVWLFRSGRRESMNPDRPEPPTTPPGPQEMVRCARCGLHLPHNEAVVGRLDLYCSPEHRDAAEA
jgi:uncharacterized protein